MSPKHRVAHRRIDLVDHTYKSFGSDYRAETGYSGARAGAKNHRRLIAYAASVQRFGRNEAPFKSGADSDQLAKAIVLTFERARLHRVERKAIEVLLLGVGAEQRLPSALCAFLKHHQRREKSPSHSRRHRLAHRIWKCTRRQG